MTDDPRWDPQMREVRRVMDDTAAAHPPVLLEEPIDGHRAINEMLTLMWSQGGPVMAETTERWVMARGRRILCRVHRPRTDKPLPVLIWLHGGGWVWSSVDTVDKLVREYAEGAEVATVSVDYSLSPEARFPQALLECAAVARHVAARGAEWGLDPGRIVIGGDSAGGNLAFATALLLRDTGHAILRGVMTAYPVAAPDFDTSSYVEFAEGYGLTRAGMKAYWNAYTRDPADCHNPLAAPLRADLAGLPPALIQLAELDVLNSEGEALAAKLRAAGVPVELETYKGMLHGFIRLTDEVAVAPLGHDGRMRLAARPHGAAGDASGLTFCPTFFRLPRGLPNSHIVEGALFFSLPLCGEGRGGGGAALKPLDLTCRCPPPRPSPQGGGRGKGISDHDV